MKKIVLSFILALFLISVIVPVATATENRPRIIISQFTTDPAPVTPGEEFNLSLELYNVGSPYARAVKATLDIIDGQEAITASLTQGQDNSNGNAANTGGSKVEKVFAPVATGNVMYLDKIKGQSKGNASIKLITPGDIKPGVYKLVINLEYTNDSGAPFNSTEVIGLKVYPKANLKLVGLKYPKSVKPGEEFQITTDIVNAGISNIASVAVSLERLESDNSSLYLGTFEPEDSDTFEAKARLNGSDDKPRLIVTFLDSSNKEQKIEQPLEIKVLKGDITEVAGSEVKGKKGGFFSGLKKFFLGLFGLGGVNEES